MKIDPPFQQIGAASDIQINRLQERADICEGATLSPRVRNLEAIANLHSREGEKA